MSIITPVMHLMFCSNIPFIEILIAYNEVINPIIIKRVPKTTFFFNEVTLLLVLKRKRNKIEIGESISNKGMIKVFMPYFLFKTLYSSKHPLIASNI